MQITERRRVVTLMALATLVSTINIVDRSLLNILAESIKLDLGLSDTQLGLLTGFSFALFYSAVGLPIARYVDRPTSDRPLVISVCIAVWSFMTMVSGAAVNFGQIVIARILVATGESGAGPALFTLINQTVPREMRARALGVYGVGPPLGTLIGLVVGGWLVDLVGWRMTFVIVGAPGLLLALVIKLMLHEPRKGGDTVAPAGPVPSLRATMTTMVKVPQFVLIATAMGTSGILLLGIPTFAGVYLIRVLGLSAGHAGLILGLSMGLAGIFGALCGGVLGDRLGRRNPAHATLSPAIGLLLGIPAALIAFTADDWRIFAAFFWIQAFGYNFYMGPAVARIQAVVPEACQAMSTFVAFMLMNLIGLGLGPLFIGAGSDLLRPDFGVYGLRWMLVACSLFAVVPAFFYIRASGWAFANRFRQSDQDIALDIPK